MTFVGVKEIQKILKYLMWLTSIFVRRKSNSGFCEETFFETFRKLSMRNAHATNTHLPRCSAVVGKFIPELFSSNSATVVILIVYQNFYLSGVYQSINLLIIFTCLQCHMILVICVLLSRKMIITTGVLQK